LNASRIHLTLAALMGAAGVALWALAAHRGGPTVVIAAQMLLIQAAVVPGLTACRKQGLVHDRTARIAISVIILGTVLFSVDLAIRTLAGFGLFPMAAPAGGVLMISGWLLAALAALIG
jgi:uncharacterized membrane protein YgdD (TMEM256/DUF423 family)